MAVPDKDAARWQPQSADGAKLEGMSSTEASYKFDERKALVQSKAKLAALVGMEKAESIYNDAVSRVSSGGEMDEAAVVDAIEQAYEHAVRRESLP